MHPEPVAEFLASLYRDTDQSFTCEPSNLDELQAWQERARPELHRLLGLGVLRKHCEGYEPTVSIEKTEKCEGYTRSLCEIQTEPAFSLPFYLLKPDSPGPFPLAVLPHGHDKRGMDTYVGKAHDDDHRRKIQMEDRDVAVQAVSRGFMAIAPAARGTSTVTIPDVNDRHGHLDCRSQMMHAIVAGRTATGERVWDVLSLIDWATKRDYVDSSRILVMGNSGGGVITFYTAAADPRVTCAVPSCSFVPFVSRSGYIHHCDCNVVPGIMRFGEIWDVCGLIAPRPLCIVNGRHDKLFPVEEVERAVRHLRPIYEAARAGERFQHHFGPAGHRFYADLMWPFIERTFGIKC